jgi:hypothetical protein
MDISRRVFISVFLFRPVQKNTLSAGVQEVFEDASGTLAALVHHAEPAAREAFGEWLRSHPQSLVHVRTGAGEEAAGKMFRVRMCFGRGLIIFEKPVQLRERDVLVINR